MEHGQLRSDGGVGVAAAFPLRKQEILNLNWLHAQITTSFEQLEVTRPTVQGCAAQKGGSAKLSLQASEKVIHTGKRDTWTKPISTLSIPKRISRARSSQPGEQVLAAGVGSSSGLTCSCRTEPKRARLGTEIGDRAEARN